MNDLFYSERRKDQSNAEPVILKISKHRHVIADQFFCHYPYMPLRVCVCLYVVLCVCLSLSRAYTHVRCTYICIYTCTMRMSCSYIVYM